MGEEINFFDWLKFKWPFPNVHSLKGKVKSLDVEQKLL